MFEHKTELSTPLSDDRDRHGRLTQTILILGSHSEQVILLRVQVGDIVLGVPKIVCQTPPEGAGGFPHLHNVGQLLALDVGGNSGWHPGQGQSVWVLVADQGS